MAHIVVFGDSIAYGAWDDKGGWVSRLRNFIDSRSPQTHFVYNLGISGDSSRTLLERFESELQKRIARIDPEEALIVVFAIGTNDSYFVHSKNDNNVPLIEFQKNISILIKQARAYSTYVLFVGMFPIVQTHVDPLPWDPDKSYKDRYVLEYNNALKDVLQKGVPFVDLLDLIKNKEALLSDGLHPNSEGHEAIYEQVKKVFIEKKYI